MTGGPTGNYNYDTKLLKTIKITKNLFSLTERLPKAKYRQNHNYSVMNQDISDPILDKSNNNNRNNSISYNTPSKLVENSIEEVPALKVQSSVNPANASNLLKVNKSSLRLKQKKKKSGLKSPPIDELNEDDSIQVGAVDYEADGFEEIDVLQKSKRLDESDVKRLNVDSSTETLQRPPEVTVKVRSTRKVIEKEEETSEPHEINNGNQMNIQETQAEEQPAKIKVSARVVAKHRNESTKPSIIVNNHYEDTEPPLVIKKGER